MPEVSICLTTYNRASVIGATIDSLLLQTFTDFELIINDDCSTDDTEKICNEYMRKDHRVKYYCNTTNLKMPGNLNEAIGRASGKYIANLHDGDIYRPDLIEKWHQIMHQNPEVNFVFNQYNMLDRQNKLVCVYDHGMKEVEDGFLLRKYMYNTLSSAPWGTVMAKREAYERNGLFNAEYGFISDIEMWMRLSCTGSVGYVNEPLISLTPRERTHKYFLPDATIFYTNLLIIYRYFLNEPIENVVDSKSIQKNIQKQLKRSMFLLMKYGNISRLREFNFLFMQSGYFMSMFYLIPFLLFGSSKPANVDVLMWKSICNIK